MSVKINIEPISVGALGQYPANAIYVNEFRINPTTFDSPVAQATVDIRFTLVNIDGGNETQVPDPIYATYSINVDIDRTTDTLNAIILKCKEEILAYSPLFVEA